MKSTLLNINELLKELFSSEEIEILNIVLEKDEKIETKLSKLLGAKKDV
ncbi:MAG: hypothetical protein ACTSPI_07150 [Candidatus Heimdallarchaeaceae archaeon]